MIASQILVYLSSLPSDNFSAIVGSLFSLGVGILSSRRKKYYIIYKVGRIIIKKIQFNSLIHQKKKVYKFK